MKRYAPAAARNSGPIAQVLAKELPPHGKVLEIASGMGEHAVFFARRFPNLSWQPSDADAEAFASVQAWRSEARAGNLLEPIVVNAAAPPWAIDSAAAILCINMIHISEWAATLGLFAGAATILPPDAPLILYGPFLEKAVETAASNLLFDRSLRERNNAWGLRHAEAVDRVAEQNGLRRTARYPMPANNIMLVYRRADQP